MRRAWSGVRSALRRAKRWVDSFAVDENYRLKVMKYQLKKEALESIPTQREQNEKKMKKLVAELGAAVAPISDSIRSNNMKERAKAARDSSQLKLQDIQGVMGKRKKRNMLKANHSEKPERPTFKISKLMSELGKNTTSSNSASWVAAAQKANIRSNRQGEAPDEGGVAMPSVPFDISAASKVSRESNTTNDGGDISNIFSALRGAGEAEGGSESRGEGSEGPSARGERTPGKR